MHIPTDKIYKITHPDIRNIFEFKYSVNNFRSQKIETETQKPHFSFTSHETRADLHRNG